MAQIGKNAALVIYGLALAGTLAVPRALSAKLPFKTLKNENNPNKIGHRNVAHWSFISPERELEIGKQLSAQIDRSVRLGADPVVERFVRQVAENVARHSDWNGQIITNVIDIPGIGSCSLPGGSVYVTSGLLRAADNEDEVAAAVAYQIAHLAAHHWASLVTETTILQYAEIPPFKGPTATGVRQEPTEAPWFCSRSSIGLPAAESSSGASGVPIAFLGFVRSDELEADYLALQYMYKAGYDPGAYVRLLRRVPFAGADPQGTPEAFRTAPPVAERVKQAEQEIRKILPNASPRSKAGEDFRLMKSHL